MPRPNGVDDFGRWLESPVLEGEERDPFSWSDVTLLVGGAGVGWKVEKQEEKAESEEGKRGRGRQRRREREGGHLAIKNTY